MHARAPVCGDLVKVKFSKIRLFVKIEPEKSTCISMYFKLLVNHHSLNKMIYIFLIK